MMIVNPVTNGIVLDHITAGKAMKIYEYLQLERLECPVAILKNVDSQKMGRKDIIKIFEKIDIDLNAIGYIDPGITVSFIEDGKITERRKLELPDTITNVIKCHNPRCITSIEQELPQIFKLAKRETGLYRCFYCEQKARKMK